MTLKITSLRADFRQTPVGNMRNQEVPYIIVNCTFRITDDSTFKNLAIGEASDYCKNLAVDDPKRYEDWIENHWSMNGYDGFQRVWILQDRTWEYLEKFDTFWLREWVADCSVTRAILADLEFYKREGRLPDVYRHTDEGTILRHLRTLDRYWD